MFSSQHNLMRLAWALLALLAMQGPARGQCETLTFRNDSQTAVWVHVSVISQGRMTLVRPTLLNPRTATKIYMAGDKIITLYDARVPTRQLFKDTIHSSSVNQLHSIQYDQAPRLKLVQIYNSGS